MENKSTAENLYTEERFAVTRGLGKNTPNFRLKTEL